MRKIQSNRSVRRREYLAADGYVLAINRHQPCKHHFGAQFGEFPRPVVTILHRCLGSSSRELRHAQQVQCNRTGVRVPRRQSVSNPRARTQDVLLHLKQHIEEIHFES